MDIQKFNTIFAKQFDRCADVLVAKGVEYAGPEDRLHNFKIAGKLSGVSPRKALAGMMIKHVVSVYDMCKDDTRYPMVQWDEKITDTINYLILLRAVVEEELILDELDKCKEHFLNGEPYE